MTNLRSTEWTVGDFNSDMHRLTALLDVICTVQFELPPGEVDPRIDDLLWIARAIAEGLREHDDQKDAEASS